jgi:hypothetical protein
MPILSVRHTLMQITLGFATPPRNTTLLTLQIFQIDRGPPKSSQGGHVGWQLICVMETRLLRVQWYVTVLYTHENHPYTT